MASSERRYDIVLWGATGFAGRLVAEYLQEAMPSEGNGGQWAIAGRNRDKLERLRDALEGASPDILVGDAFDRESLESIAGQTSVVCSTVGPYAKFGNELVAACVAEGADYCDLTGEPHWIRRMVDEHHDEAEAKGVRIVHCCGFDSIPSDMGALAVQRQAYEQYGAPCEDIHMLVRGASGGVSGGTAASMANLFEEAAGDREIRKIVADPYSLNPPGAREGPDGGWQQGVRWDELAETWTAPFLMASVNEKIVRRTNAVCEWPYGREFRYGESLQTGSGMGGAMRAGAIAAGVAALGGAMAIKPTRYLLERWVFPASGDGPDRETIEGGYFSIAFVGRGTTDSGESFRVTQKVSGDRDPGYGATATMLGESARYLADEASDGANEERAWLSRPPGGVLTPASAMGTGLIERLDGVGIEFEETI
jgi:short subunit dehydrogenase-like uncharacterized protein